MLNIHPSSLLFPSCCTASPLLSFTPWLCSRVARRKGAGQGQAQAQRWLMYGFWRGNTAQATRECGNVRMARCPPGPAHSAPCLEAAFLLVPGGRGMKEGTGGLVGGHRPGIKQEKGSGAWWRWGLVVMWGLVNDGTVLIHMWLITTQIVHAFHSAPPSISVYEASTSLVLEYHWGH